MRESGPVIAWVLAALAIAALALRPRSAWSAAAVAGAAALDVLLVGARVGPSLRAVAPMVAFLTAALTLAALVERAGLAERAAAALARHARGSMLTLYVATCAMCALLTAVVSLDGAVVLMVPVALALARRHDAPLPALFAGVVVVANAASIAVPMGNPTNLVVVERLGISTGAFVAHMLLPGIVAAVTCAAGVALHERDALTARRRPAAPAPAPPLSRAERHAAAALLAAAAAAWAAAPFGVQPWRPFAAVTLLALLTAPRASRPRPIVPWRLGVQVLSLLVVTSALGVHLRSPASLGAAGLAGIALAVGAASALANNLPVSVCVAGLLSAGPSAYAALIGLGVGSLATPHGSLATLIATDLAGEHAPRARLLRSAALAAAGVLLAALLLAGGV